MRFKRQRRKTDWSIGYRIRILPQYANWSRKRRRKARRHNITKILNFVPSRIVSFENSVDKDTGIPITIGTDEFGRKTISLLNAVVTKHPPLVFTSV